VIKRISLLITAALMMAMMMVATAAPAFADPDCTQVPNNKNCQTTTTLPSGNEPNTGSNACAHNPNCDTDTTFKGRPQ
jgi:hypothetical protein